MNDYYLSLANSNLGKNIFEALNLPKPPELLRDNTSSLNAPKGAILVAASKGSRYQRGLITALSSPGVTLYSPIVDGNTSDQFANLLNLKSESPLQGVNLSNRSQRQFKAIVFDASGIQELSGLDAVYTLLHATIGRLKPNGRLVIVTQPDQRESVVSDAISVGLQGFIKSLAKELGKKGICCNLLEVVKASERQLKAPLYFLLSPKSAYVTGQSLQLKASGAGPRKFDWDQPLKDKNILVTGAAQGIGRATAEILARDGARVIALDIPANSSRTKQLAQAINGHAVDLDLSDEDAPQQILELIASQLGGIDGIVHNAGITRDKTLARMPEHFWNQVITINLARIVEINQRLIEHSAFNPQAKIVCIASISGIAGNFGQSNYALSKATIAAYTQKMAPNLTGGLTINAIAPGFIETEMTKKIPWLTRELGRRGNSLSQGGLPEDVAEAVSLFCHPAASALNGNVLRVCGQSLLGR
ncbi:MAG: 3-oxoacyl-ACP reductase [Oleiphilaceae bacterium]|nr:3-oxoacyl-ACP reductase [Oleiphilaceae bacterium]